MRVNFILAVLLLFNLKQLSADQTVNQTSLQQLQQPSVEAERFRVGVMLGESQTDIAGIDSALTGQIYFDADMNRWLGGRIGYRSLDNFSTKTLSTVELEYTESIYLGLTFSYPNSTLFVPYGGIEYINWKLKSTALGEELGRTDGSGAALHAGLRFNMTPFMGLNLQYGQMNDISDADIEYIQFGVYLRFR